MVEAIKAVIPNKDIDLDDFMYEITVCDYCGLNPYSTGSSTLTYIFVI